VHEVGVHRADAELALGRTARFEPEVAADGVDELLDDLPHAAYFAPGVEELRGAGESIGLAAEDADLRWRIHLLPDRFDWVRHETDATEGDVVVRGAAGDLLLALYGRPATVSVTGDAALWERWLRDSAI
jgi:hypothetical protein